MGDADGVAVVGAKVGIAVGIELGIAVVGAKEGVAVVGAKEGIGVGFELGALGATEGTTVGAADDTETVLGTTIPDPE